jgi:hypothetical protein
LVNYFKTLSKIEGVFYKIKNMNILKINTTPVFQFISRKDFNAESLEIQLVSETKGTTQNIECTPTLLANGNYDLLLSVFPNGKANETFSFTILNDADVLCLGKLMIVASGEVVQNHSKKTNKYY